MNDFSIGDCGPEEQREDERRYYEEYAQNAALKYATQLEGKEEMPIKQIAVYHCALIEAHEILKGIQQSIDECIQVCGDDDVQEDLIRLMDGSISTLMRNLGATLYGENNE